MKNNLKIFLNVIFYIISIGIYVWGMLGDFFEIPTIYNPILTQIIGLVLLIFFFARNNFQLRKSIKEYQDQAPEINVKSINLRALPFSYYYEESNPSREYAAGTASPINLI